VDAVWPLAADSAQLATHHELEQRLDSNARVVLDQFLQAKFCRNECQSSRLDSSACVSKRTGSRLGVKPQ
jgi:hypothetical protein